MGLSAASIATGLGLVFTLPVAGQDSRPEIIQPENTKPLGVVLEWQYHDRFCPADSRDIDMVRLRT
jgi:hypothetical protein